MDRIRRDLESELGFRLKSVLSRKSRLNALRGRDAASLTAKEVTQIIKGETA